MPREFPAIVNFGSAFRFALEAEQSCADLAAAAQVLAPDPEWADKLDYVVCVHDDRVKKLTITRQEVNEMLLEPFNELDGAGYTKGLDEDPATDWPQVVEQLAAAEEAAARYHDDFVARGGELLAAAARHFTKAARQDRELAAELREKLG